MVLDRLLLQLKKIFKRKKIDTETENDPVQEPQTVPIRKHNDELSMYFGLDYIINDKITIFQPSIMDIVEFGEEKYYSVASTLTAIPSDMKSILYDMGIDYEKISDFELFTMLSTTLSKEDTVLLLGDIDLSKFVSYRRTDDDQIFMYDEVNDIIIDQNIYLLLVDYIRKMHGFQVKVEKAANEFTKRILIQDDRDKRAINKSKGFKSILKPLISSMINSEGFKYKSHELKNVGLCEFMDSVKRISAINTAKSLSQAVYSGAIEQIKVKKELDWMRELD